jgi:lysylphosphatidylglycerol synthetase-like protein (DUF2156 family)
MSISPARPASRANAVFSPEPIHLYRRAWTAYFSLPFGVLLCIAGTVMAYVVHDYLRAPANLVVPALLVVFSLGLGWATARGAYTALTSKQAVLSIDEGGVTHVDGGETFMAWSEIARISTTHHDGDRLAIWFTRNSDHSRRVGNARALAQRALTGADFTVYLGNLVYNPTILKRTVAAYHAGANLQARVRR